MIAKNRKPGLEDTVPEGLLINRKFLIKKGFNRPLVDYYMRTGGLEAVARGVYRRPGPTLKWQHVVYSLTVLGYPIHVGGRFALEQQGLRHYLRRDGMERIDLYGLVKLPNWLCEVEAGVQFELHKPRLFVRAPEEAIVTTPFGHWDWPIPFARTELALLELLAEVRTDTDFEVADKLFESAVSLSPRLVTSLLMGCQHIKAKRLFLWFAERHGHSWVKHLELDKVGLGSGKRVIVKGGALDAKYLITVPRNMTDQTDGPEQSIF